MRKTSILKTLCFTWTMAFLGTAGAAVPGDFEGDGLSDLSTVSVNRTSKTTIWAARLSSGQVPFVWFFNVPGDALVTGQFYRGYPRTTPAIVYVRDALKPLEWYFKTPTGTEETLVYGLPGDTIPNQGDLDCDGVADLVVARSGDRVSSEFKDYLIWYVLTSSHPGNVQRMLFGLKGDQPSLADLDGDGCAELVVLRKDFTWYSKKLFAELGATSAVQWGLPGDFPLLPTDFDGDGRADYVVARIEGANQTAYIRYANGGTEVRTLGTRTSVPMTGNFFGFNGFGWQERSTGFAAVQQADGVPFVFRHGNATTAIVRPDGTVVQPNQTGQIGTGATTGGSGTDGNGDVRCDGQIKREDGGGGFVNNPNSSRNTMKINFPSNLTGNIDSVRLYHDGKLYEQMYYGGFEYGNRERYYGKKSISSYPDNILVQVELESGRFLCVTIPDPQRRYD